MYICPNCGSSPGDRRLSAGEIQTITLLVDGLSDREIGTQIGFTQSTIKHRLKRIYRKLGIPPVEHKRLLLAVWWNCELFQSGLRELGMLA